MATKPKSNKASSGRKTVASLSVEVEALRAEVAELRQMVEGRTEASGGQSVGEAVHVVATPVAPAPKPIDAIRGLLTQAFTLALTPIPADPDEAEELFMRFAGLMHSDRRGTPLLNQSLKNYTWRQFRNNAAVYLNEDADPSSFIIHRTNPDPLYEAAERVKVFVRARTRMPPPVNFKRDTRDGGQWRIESSSL